MFEHQTMLSSLFFMTMSILAIRSQPIETINYTLDLIKRGEHLIEFGKHDNVLLLMGNTGAGKSTLAQLMAGDNNKLFSREVSKDSGEFVIEDFDNKISNNSTLITQTIFPELFFNNVTNSAFYDCPGFSDTRNSSVNIAATYFIRKVILSVKAIKAIFVVNYPSVKEGVDRKDFFLLVKHAATVFKNFDKFKNSVVLVVTKVDNSYIKKNEEVILVPDVKIVENIANFLQKAKLSLIVFLANEIDFEKKTTYENAIKLVDIFLTKENNVYKKIGIYRRPDEEGPLTKIKLMQKAKTNLQDIFDKNIAFEVKTDNDFGYTISEESKCDINDLIKNVFEDLSYTTKRIAKNLTNIYRNFEDQFTDITILRDQFDLAFSTFSNMTKIFESAITSKDIANAIQSSIQTLPDLLTANINISNITQYDSFIQFIEEVTNKKFPLKSLDFVQAFQTLVKYLGDSSNYYKFLIGFNLKLSEWSIQQNPERFNVNSIKSQISELQDQNVVVTGNHIKKFLDQIYYEEMKNGLSIPGFEIIKDTELNPNKIEVLNEILYLSLNPEFEVFCEDNDKLIAKGDFVKVSSVFSNALCSERVLTVEIFGANKIFIDQNIQKVGGNIKFLMASRVLEVIDIREINLIGESARLRPDFKAANGADGAGGAFDGAPGGNGKDGAPGRKGLSGGSFFGISNIMINGHNLRIASIGGNGSPGQEGGNGGNGANGNNGFFFGDIGARGGAGGNGGNGAKGGNFGRPSEVLVVCVIHLSSAKLEQINGQQGADGAGGIHGIGGTCGSRSGIWNECIPPKASDGSDGGLGVIPSPDGFDEPVTISKINFIQTYKAFINSKINRITVNALKNHLRLITENEILRGIK